MPHNDLAQASSHRSAADRQAELVDLVARFTATDGSHRTVVAPLHLIRASAPSPLGCTVYEPCMCVVVQGCKQALIAGEPVRYDPLHYVVVSMTLPAIAQIVEATPEQPYLCVRIDIDPGEIGSLMLDAGLQPSPRGGSERALQLARVSDPLLDAVLRLLRLLGTPQDARVLAPLALREIFYRVLTGELGPRLRELAVADSRVQRIARAVDLLKRRYADPVPVDELAALVNMSPSSLHHHFKAVTAMSPLQFQKQLRLHEARRIMLVEGIDAASAAHRVGYESPSQFSREYRRLFGVSPRREIVQLRTAEALSTPQPATTAA